MKSGQYSVRDDDDDAEGSWWCVCVREGAGDGHCVSAL